MPDIFVISVNGVFPSTGNLWSIEVSPRRMNSRAEKVIGYIEPFLV